MRNLTPVKFNTWTFHKFRLTNHQILVGIFTKRTNKVCLRDPLMSGNSQMEFHGCVVPTDGWHHGSPSNPCLNVNKLDFFFFIRLRQLNNYSCQKQACLCCCWMKGVLLLAGLWLWLSESLLYCTGTGMVITCPLMAPEAFWHMPFFPGRTGRVTSTSTMMKPGQWVITWVSLWDKTCRKMLPNINICICKGFKFWFVSSVWKCLRLECVFWGGAAVDQNLGERRKWM